MSIILLLFLMRFASGKPHHHDHDHGSYNHWPGWSQPVTSPEAALYTPPAAGYTPIDTYSPNIPSSNESPAGVPTPIQTSIQTGVQTGIQTDMSSAAPISPVSPVPPSSSAGAPVSGDTFTGDITFYNVSDGLSSCGPQFSNDSHVCALATSMMANGPNPNTNPKCYTYITLTNPGNPGSSYPAEIVSTCEACAYEDVDLSPALFQLVAPNGNGRVGGVSWHFN